MEKWTRNGEAGAHHVSVVAHEHWGLTEQRLRCRKSQIDCRHNRKSIDAVSSLSYIRSCTTIVLTSNFPLVAPGFTQTPASLLKRS